MIHRVKPERTDLDMIYEIMLKLGAPLTYSVTPFTVNNKPVYGAVSYTHLMRATRRRRVLGES